MRSDNPIADYDAFCASEDRWLSSRPVCIVCDEHIQEDVAYDFGGDMVCEHCIGDYIDGFKVPIIENE